MNRYARLLVLVAGLATLVHLGVVAYGGWDKVGAFTPSEASRSTSMSMLSGTLRLRDDAAQVSFDEEVFDGAVYTNWGFGVPLLELPFHAAARWLHACAAGFFPDRTIYAVYLSAALVAFWFALDRTLARRLGPARSVTARRLLSLAGTFAAFTCALYPVSCCRFQIYEETICYAVLCQLAATAAYLLLLESRSPGPAVALGLTASLGLVVRPTGLMYLGMWAALLVAHRRDRKTLAAFAASALPMVAFWTISNRVRTGSFTGLGLDNSMPFQPYHTALMRFGSTCTDTWAHRREFTRALFDLFFFRAAPPAAENLQKCHFTMEGHVHPQVMVEPVFGLPVLLLLAGAVLHAVFFARRGARAALLAPVATFAVLFASYVYAGGGFAWRYYGDFSPLLVVLALQLVRVLPASVDRLLGARAALGVAALGALLYYRDVLPYLDSVQSVGVRDAGDLLGAFQVAHSAPLRITSNRIECGTFHEPIYHNGLGWLPDCTVDTVTNVFLGVVPRSGRPYQVRFKAEGTSAPELRVYFNGRVYVARPVDDVYVADVELDPTRLAAPTVLATIEWTRAPDPPQGTKLSWVELD